MSSSRSTVTSSGLDELAVNFLRSPSPSTPTSSESPPPLFMIDRISWLTTIEHGGSSVDFTGLPSTTRARPSTSVTMAATFASPGFGASFAGDSAAGRRFCFGTEGLGIVIIIGSKRLLGDEDGRLSDAVGFCATTVSDGVGTGTGSLRSGIVASGVGDGSGCGV